jgi:hypothetical protein
MFTKSMRFSRCSDKEVWELYRKVSEAKSIWIHRDVIACAETLYSFNSCASLSLLPYLIFSVKIKEGKVGGSAFGKKPKKGLFGFGLLGRNKDASSNKALGEQSEGDHVYALKSILLDRVSPVFIQELLNEGM